MCCCSFFFAFKKCVQLLKFYEVKGVVFHFFSEDQDQTGATRESFGILGKSEKLTVIFSRSTELLFFDQYRSFTNEERKHANQT